MRKVANIVFNEFVNDSRVLKESMSLANHGYEVVVIAHGDKNLPKEEQKDNFKIVRLNYLDRKTTKSKVKKLMIYFAWLREVISYVKDFDILHCNDLNTLPIGVITKLFFNKKVKIVYDAHEYETERYNQSYYEKKFYKYWERFLLKYTDAVITVSESIANEYVKLYSIQKPYLVLNTPFYSTIDKKNIFREKFNIPSDYIIFLYQGGLAEGRGILEFIDLIKDKNKVAYVVMGFGFLEDEIKRISSKQSNIFFHEAVSTDILLNYTSSADIGVCIEENLCKSWDFALPNKMFEYYMAGLPVIVSGLYEMKKFVKENNTGYVLEDIFNKNEFNQIFNEINNDLKVKQDNINNVKKIYNWEEQEKVLVKIYKDLEN